MSRDVGSCLRCAQASTRPTIEPQRHSDFTSANSRVPPRFYRRSGRSLSAAKARPDIPPGKFAIYDGKWLERGPCARRTRHARSWISSGKLEKTPEFPRRTRLHPADVPDGSWSSTSPRAMSSRASVTSREKAVSDRRSAKSCSQRASGSIASSTSRAIASCSASGGLLMADRQGYVSCHVGRKPFLGSRTGHAFPLQSGQAGESCDKSTAWLKMQSISRRRFKPLLCLCFVEFLPERRG